MITQRNEVVKILNSVIHLPDRGWVERHRVTRKSLQRFVTLANDLDVGRGSLTVLSTAMKLTTKQSYFLFPTSGSFVSVAFADYSL